MWGSQLVLPIKNELDVIIIPEIKIRELRPREITSLALGYRVTR
jgi:hypothetical protein